VVVHCKTFGELIGIITAIACQTELTPDMLLRFLIEKKLRQILSSTVMCSVDIWELYQVELNSKTPKNLI
jgi:hypothetical protein